MLGILSREEKCSFIVVSVTCQLSIACWVPGQNLDHNFFNSWQI